MDIKILDLVRQTQDGCVVMVYFSASKTKSDRTVSIESNVSLVNKDSSDPSFVPFDSLSEEQVVGWAKSSFGEENLVSLENELDELLDNPPKEKFTMGLPW